ncbi:hypothetical protein Hanom_Chr07g00627121 [Helianthus anomalus]
MVFLVHDCDIQLRRKMKLFRCSVLFDSSFEFVVRVNGRFEKEMTSEAFKSPSTKRERRKSLEGTSISRSR